MNIFEFIDIVKHNRAVHRRWVKNGRKIVAATVGWRRDPIYGQDGYTKVPREGEGDNVEYQRVIRQDKR